MADICESLEHSNLVYQITVDLTRRSSGRSESIFFESVDLAEVIDRTKQYLWTVPKKASVSVRGVVKVTNTYSLSGRFLEGAFKSLLQPEPRMEPTQIPMTAVEAVGLPKVTKTMLNSQEAAEILGLKMQTLNAWRIYGKGPRFVKVGGRIRYRMAELEQWIEEQQKESTSQY